MQSGGHFEEMPPSGTVTGCLLLALDQLLDLVVPDRALG